MSRMESLPPSDRTLDPEHAWITLEIPPGGCIDGYLIGEPFGCLCHTVGRTRPCRSAMTHGEIPCPLAKPGKPCRPRMYAYVPLRTTERERVVIRITGRPYATLHGNILRGTMIRIERTEGARGRLRVGFPPDEVIRQHGRWEGQRDHDIVPYLLRLWGDRLLAAWDAGRSVTDTPAQPKAPPAKRGSDNAVSTPQFTEMYNGSAFAAGIGADPDA